nr:transporter substrate-binding domain-containing protein [uncultured Holophaga sp.]
MDSGERARGAWGALLLYLALLLPGVLSPGLHAATPASPLIVGLDEDYPPYEFRNAQGVPEGYNVDLLKALERVLDLRFDLRPGVWGLLKDDLEAGRIQVLGSMLRTPDREKVFAFSNPPLQVGYALFTRQGEFSPAGLEDLRGRRVLVQRGSQMHDQLLARGLQESLDPVDSEADALRALAAGRDDAALVAHLTGLLLIRQGGFGNISPAGPPVLSRELSLAVRRDHAELLARLDTGLAILQRTGELDRIHRKWFSELETPDRSARRGLLALAGAVALLALFLGAVLVWNRTLQRRIRKHTDELQTQKDFLQGVVDSIPLMLFAKDPNHGFVFTLWNRKAEELSGRSSAEILGSTDFSHFPPGQALSFRKDDETVMSSRALRVIEEEPLDTPNGQVLLRTLKVPICDREDQPLYLLGISEDITERRRMEEALAQVQRLESLGVMAGGIAHDLNNYLTGIQGNLDLVASTLPADHPGHLFLEGAGQSIGLATLLASQMLAYAGQGAIQTRGLDLNLLLRDLHPLLQASLPSATALRLDLAPGLPQVRADERQLRQVVLNLANNASEALEGRPGTLTFHTRSETLCEAEIRILFPGQTLEAGPQVVLEVSDTGSGIAPDVLPRIFDPFFSTRFTGRGLGLPATLGILRSHGGGLRVTSRPGAGSTFIVYLPALADRI